MLKNEIWLDYKVDSKSYKSIIFRISNNKEFKIYFKLSVDGNGRDIRFLLCTYTDYQKLSGWMENKIKCQYDSNGQVVYDEDGDPIIVEVPEPQIRTFFDVRTNILNRAVNLSSGTYALLLDNTYSTLRGKQLSLHIVETWREKNTKKNLPTIQYNLDNMPPDVAVCINDANSCYMEEHYNQCAVMLRKAIEQAVKIKLFQSNLPLEQLLDKSGNEMSISSKIRFLKEKKLVTQKNASDIEQVKWFGDIGAHGTMRVTEQDIKDNIEPKIRSFLVGLNLKV